MKYLGGSDKRPAPKQPTKSPAGEEIRLSEELAEAWRAFCADTKFACTVAESNSPDYKDISDATERESDTPTVDELEICLEALKVEFGRACGPGQIPVEAYRGSESAKNDLFEFIKQCWREERLPTTLGRGTFICIFKNVKRDDSENYRLPDQPSEPQLEDSIHDGNRVSMHCAMGSFSNDYTQSARNI